MIAVILVIPKIPSPQIFLLTESYGPHGTGPRAEALHRSKSGACKAQLHEKEMFLQDGEAPVNRGVKWRDKPA